MESDGAEKVVGDDFVGVERGGGEGELELDRFVNV